jgi:hypothetical protein
MITNKHSWSLGSFCRAFVETGFVFEKKFERIANFSSDSPHPRAGERRVTLPLKAQVSVLLRLTPFFIRLSEK